ncbi:relA-associated inhibitor isoform X2 [Carcharodon carcharias]|uniref:relA-associated inhibitor isoform X2 n=1 Tax=Carcharodon carcharias TaxID=13397 RepID=UPI001B7EBC3D|nr:relA-associated inhibitor isoform X2 [Carcharodon carcharias]
MLRNAADTWCTARCHQQLMTRASVLLDQLCPNSTPYARRRMTDEQLGVSPSSLGNVFPAMLECQADLLFQSEQKKLSDATFKLDKLSQELDSMWSTQGSCAATDNTQQEAKFQTYQKDYPVTTVAASNTYGSSKLESQSKCSELLPIVSMTQSQSPHPSQAYPQLLTPHWSPSSYDSVTPPMIYSQQESRSQLDRAPSPRPMFPGSTGLYSQQEPRAQLDRAPSPRPTFPGSEPRTQPDRAPSPHDRAPSPRPMFPGSPMLYSQQEPRTQLDRAPSPRKTFPGSPVLYSQEPHTQPDRAPSPRLGFSPMTPLEKPDPTVYSLMCPVYESQSSPSGTLERLSPHQPALFSQSPLAYPGTCYSLDPFTRVGPRENVQPLLSATLRAPEPHILPSEAEDGSLGGRVKTSFALDPGAFSVNTGDTLKKKKMPSVWAEADLDIAYEKKPSQTHNYENKHEQNWNAAKQGGSWRQTDLDLAVLPNKATGMRSKANNSIQIYGTLPKGTSPSYRRYDVAHLGSPHSPWPSLPSPILARTSIPPDSPRASPIKERRNVLPLSVLIRPTIVNRRGRLPAPTRLPPVHPAATAVKRYPQLQHAQEVSRKILDFPALPPDNRHSPLPLVEAGEVESEIASILQPSDAVDPESIPRPLSPTRLQPVSLPDTEAIQDMEELLRIRAAIPRALKRRTTIEQPVAQRGPTQKRTSKYQQLTKLFTRSSQKRQQEHGEGTASPVPATPLISPTSPQTSPTSDTDLPKSLPTPVLESPTPPPAAPVTRSILKQANWSGLSRKTRARLNPLVVLLDAALLGEMDVVKRVVYEMNDPSQPNDEGITGLHNAVCGGHYNIVEFLVNFGVNINAPDSYGWTPLHCAASCNDLAICTFLVKKGAAIFSTTLSDGDTAAEKCDRYLDGYEECARFLFSAEQQAGMMNSAVVYALWDYEAENSDELSFREGDTITILRRGDKEENNWWWASLFGREGYVPYNLLGLFPRVRPVV